MPDLINWESYNRALAEIKLQDNYGSALRILQEAEMSPKQVYELAPTGESAYGYKNFADGAVATWYSNYSSTVENVPDVVTQINSNAGAGYTNTYNWQFSANTDYAGGSGGGGTGSTFGASDVTAPSGGGAISFLQNTVTPAVAAAGLGIKLGKAIDSALYNANPDFWDNVGLSSLNPGTWDSITMDMSDAGWEGVLKRGFNALLGINTQDKTAQMYIDQDAAAYLAQYMQEQGVFAAGTKEVINPNIPISDMTIYPLSMFSTFQYQYDSASPNKYWIIIAHTTCAVFANTTPLANGNFLFIIYAASAQPNTLAFTVISHNNGAVKTTDYYTGSKAYTYDNKSVYQEFYATNGYFVPPNNNYNKLGNTTNTNRICWSMVYGEINDSTPIEGMTDQDGATTPNFTECRTPQDYLNALQTQYPDMFSNAVTQTVAQPDGSVVTHKYVPIGTGTGTSNDTTTNPDATGQSQTDTLINTSTATQAQLQTLVDLLTKTFTPTLTPTKTDNPPDTGGGDTPVVTPPTGSAASLWAVYNPSQAQLNSFGAWLWSSNFIDQILKLFNNPMQSIIGVHKIFATPPTSGSASIKVGYLDSGVSANVVSAQYVTVDCGSVNVREQFGNVFDYEDTQIRLYLPFIGIVQLDTSDVMRGSVKVVYHVDVITGACLAEVRVTRDASGGTLYQFSGDAAVRYPISSGSYMGVVSGVLGVVGGIASGIMSGGATLPMAAGAIAGGLSGAKTQVQHSGSFAGNAGAMGAKKPYLIIERPQTMIADGFGNYQGKGANVARTVAQCSGYFKMSDVHTDSISGASAAEVQAIKTALESGVIK